MILFIFMIQKNAQDRASFIWTFAVVWDQRDKTEKNTDFCLLYLKILLCACFHVHSLPASLNLLRKTCSCNILKILLLLIAFIWIPIISRNYIWDCTSLSVISWDFLGWTIPRISFGQMVGKRKYFYFIPQMGNYTYRNCSSCKVMQNQWKQRGTETLSLESLTVPKRQSTFDHEITPHCSVFASPRWQLVECHKCCSAAERCMCRCSSRQLCPSLGKANLYRWAATLSLAGARRDVHQDILMAAKPEGKGLFLGGEGGYCLLNIVSFLLLLTQPIANLQSDVRNWEQNSN